jgi:hypothetical protein
MEVIIYQCVVLLFYNRRSREKSWWQNSMKWTWFWIKAERKKCNVSTSYKPFKPWGTLIRRIIQFCSQPSLCQCSWKYRKILSCINTNYTWVLCDLKTNLFRTLLPLRISWMIAVSI